MRKLLLSLGMVFCGGLILAVLFLGVGHRAARPVRADGVLKTVQDVATTAITPTFNTITSTNGISFVNDGRVLAVFLSTSTDSEYITVTTPFSAAGLDLADLSTTIGAGEYRVIGPFPPQYFNYQTGTQAGRTVIQCSSLTSVTVALLHY